MLTIPYCRVPGTGGVHTVYCPAPAAKLPEQGNWNKFTSIKPTNVTTTVTRNATRTAMRPLNTPRPGP